MLIWRLVDDVVQGIFFLIPQYTLGKIFLVPLKVHIATRFLIGSAHFQEGPITSDAFEIIL